MKTSFKLNSTVEASPAITALGDAGKAKLVQAVEAYLNSMRVLSEDATRGSLREVKKNSRAEMTEQVKVLYAGDRNIVSAFLQHHDRIVSAVKRCESLHLVGFTVADYPAPIAAWIAKFKPAPAPATTPAASPAKPAKANGKVTA